MRSLIRSIAAPLCLLPILCTVGCNVVADSGVTTSPIVSAHIIEGSVFGGQQPVVGAKIQLYVAGAPTSGGGYGLGSTALIPTALQPVTDANGAFSITGLYTLPTTASHLYIVATGGVSSSGFPANNGIAEMAVLEGCTGSTILSPTLFININEVTTVASVVALQAFIATPVAGNLDAPAIGAPSTAIGALANAFETANDLASISTGVAQTHANNYATTDANGQLVNSLADILAYCVNSNISGGQCSTLFTAATPSSAPYTAKDTIQAALYIAQNPANNVPALFNFASAAPPYIGLATAPTSFTTTVATSGSACQAAIPLGTAGNYAILAGTSVTNASTASDQTVITGGNVGVSPGTSETGFVTGTYVAVFDNTNAGGAEGALTAAYNTAAGLLLPAVLPGDMSNLTFSPGLYNTGSAVTLNSGAVTLDALGDPNAVFVFQIGTSFVAGTGTQVILVNGAQSGNVYWQVGSSATINSSAQFVGNILAHDTVTFGTDATLHGRAMASTGAVTMLSNKITIP